MVFGMFPSDMQGMGIAFNITMAVCPLKALYLQPHECRRHNFFGGEGVGEARTQ